MVRLALLSRSPCLVAFECLLVPSASTSAIEQVASWSVIATRCLFRMVSGSMFELQQADGPSSKGRAAGLDL